MGSPLWSGLMHRAWRYIRKTWVWVLVLLLPSCVMLVKWCNFSRLQVLISETGMSSYLAGLLWGLNNTRHAPPVSHTRWVVDSQEMPLPFLFSSYVCAPALHTMPGNSLFCSEIFPTASVLGLVFLQWLCGVYFSSLSFWLPTWIWPKAAA